MSMQRTIRILLLSALLAAAPAAAPGRAEAGPGPDAPGAGVPVRPLDAQEREALGRAAAAAPGLAELRGGHFEDQDLEVAAVVLLGVIALALIL